MLIPKQNYNPNWWAPPGALNGALNTLRQQGFQVQMPQSPAVPRPAAQGASTRPAGYGAAVGNVNQRTQDQLARNRAMQAQMGLDASWNRAANAPSSAQARYEKQMEEWRAKNAAALAQRQSEGRAPSTPLAGLTQQPAEPAYTPFTGRKWWQTTSRPGVYR